MYAQSPEGSQQTETIVVESSVQSSVNRAKIGEKREMHDLNQRLEMYVQNQSNRQHSLRSLKTTISKQEIEFRERLKSQEASFEVTLSQVRSENENLQMILNDVREELESSIIAKRDLNERLVLSETRTSELVREVTSIKQELDRLRMEQYKYDKYDAERTQNLSKIQILKDKYKLVSNELSRHNSEHRVHQDTFTRLLSEKNKEFGDLTVKFKTLQQTHDEEHTRLRAEFDTKLKVYVENRENQYTQEKDEWSRIFKEEFGRKMRTFKETNFELDNANKKQQEELYDFRSRLSQLKKTKTELDATNRHLEEELEKTRADIDHLRKTKDHEIRKKCIILSELRETLKRKEMEFDELYSSKIQLTQEIELFRRILCEAEENADYTPLASTRKKRRLTNGEDACYQTPGIVRAAITARNFMARSLTASRDEMKDQESDTPFYVDNSDSEHEFEAVTPGAIYPLQFSNMDLSQSMIEIKNTSDKAVCLAGYYLSNFERTEVFPLPDDRTLAPNERTRIIIGSNSNAAPGEILWKADVWKGDNKDVARLFDFEEHEIARIEITPDMLPDRVKTKCLVM